MVQKQDENMDMEIQPVPWWNRRSRMERRFIMLTCGLLLVSVGLAVGLTGIIYKDDLVLTSPHLTHHPRGSSDPTTDFSREKL